ncbi:hypothetical protein ACTFIY_007885 [Dictyostelium cf. discoideum]
MKVNCHLPNNENQTIEFDLNLEKTSIHDLKSLISDKTGTPIHNLIIEMDKKKLTTKYDKKKLSNFKVSENSDIRMMYDLEGGCGGGCDLCGLGGGCHCVVQ